MIAREPPVASGGHLAGAREDRRPGSFLIDRRDLACTVDGHIPEIPEAKLNKNDLVREILNGVSRDRLQVAIGFIWADRHRRATGQGEDVPVSIDPKLVNDVEGFIATCSVRQLKLLRKIALGLEKDTSPLQ